MPHLVRATERLARLLALAGIAGLALLAGVTMLDVALRFFAGRPVVGLSDITEMVAIVCIAAAFPILLVRRANVSVRVGGALLGPSVGRWLEVFADLATSGFFVLMAWQFVRLSHDLAIHHQTSYILGLPVAPAWWLASVVMMIAALTQLVGLGRQIALALGPR